MKISSISVAAVALLAGKASASTPTRLRAMTGIEAITEDDAMERFANLPPFFQALANPDNVAQSQFIQELMAEDELSEYQYDFLGASPSSMSMSVSVAGSMIANDPGGSGGSGGGVGWDGKSKSGKGNDCTIEQMKGNYVFKYDLWESTFGGTTWDTKFTPPLADRGVLLRFSRPRTASKTGKGRGAMEGFMCVPGFESTEEYAVAIQTGVSQKDVIPFRINFPGVGPDVSVQGEFNCKTEEVYFGLDFNVNEVFAFGFTTRKPAKKRSNNFNPCS